MRCTTRCCSKFYKLYNSVSTHSYKNKGIFLFQPQKRFLQCELIRYFDYPCEVGQVTTEDNYVIEVDRVPWGRQENATATNEQGGTHRYPVLLVPPFLSGSDLWFLNYPSQSLGKCLKLFLSFDEIGRYDIPAVVDHVLNATGARKLTLVCMSQGGATSLAFLSMRPEYNDKVDLVVAYCPVANISHLEAPLSLLMPFTPIIAAFAYPVSKAGYLEVNEGLSEILTKMCKIFNGGVCSMGFTLSLTASPYQLNEMYRAKDFVMYDHGGKKENRKRYGQAKAPPYPLERITTPWVIFSSEGDQLADPRDIKDLVARLGSRVMLHRVVPQRTFRHVDFAMGYRANDFLHDVAIDVIKQHVYKDT
ncbi:hypothetical protein MTO96_019395 [Rhipicephalus appendiculatus]